MPLNKNSHHSKSFATTPPPLAPLFTAGPTSQAFLVWSWSQRAKSRGVITTSFGVNGADVGLASVKQNNALKGIWTQWAFLLYRRCLSIAACSAGMLSRWHTERQRRPRPFQVPLAEKHQWVHVWRSCRGLLLWSVWALASGGVI